MTRRALKDLVTPVQTLNPQSDFDGKFTYIDISSLDQGTKRVVGARSVPSDEAPSRARQLVRAGDILVSTVRPNLNAVAAVPAELDEAIASTGFCVLRPGPDLDSGYLKHWVMTSEFVSSMVRQATGQSYPAVSDRIVKQSTLPVPSVERQQQIAAVLDQVNALRAKRRQAITLLDDLTQSIFLDMFGDPATNQRGWPTGSVADLVKRFETGKNLAPGDEGEGKFRVLKVSAVTSGEFNPEESKPLPVDYTPPAAHMVKSGDLLFSRANTEELIGAVALIEVDHSNLALPDKLWRFTWKDPDHAHPLYIRQLFRQGEFRRQVRERSSGTSGSMKNISQANVLSIECGIPPLDLRKRFSERAAEIDALRSVQRSHLAALDELFISIQQRAFSGTLWDHEAAA
ncbi:restriction endonuclease subunit S [Streptomyces sp. NPDC085596]|uniref:restriction endonuclease subunit S n=1 Tax=Streptomyces sp. NPDC085596 TaxID=3365731 RepID=UPI0037CF080F